MAAVLLRRSVAAAVLATVATALVPTAVSLAAPSAFAATSITTDPAPDSNNVVAANRPKIVATYNAAPASGTITLTAEGGNGANLCGTPVIDSSKKTVTCQAKADLDPSKKYDAVGSATDSGGHKAKTSKLTFTVDYPVLDGPNSTPIPGGSFIDGSQDLTAAFNEPISGNDKDTRAADGAFKLFEVNADGTQGAQLPGTITFNGNALTGSDDTVSFNPDTNLADGRYQVVLLVHGVQGSPPNTSPNPDATGRATYPVFVSHTAPFNLANAGVATTANNTAYPFTGDAAPGLTINVTVTDPKNSNPLTNTFTGSGTVAPCASAPSCPWTVPVDISKMTSPQQGVDWTAQAEDFSQATTAASNGPKFNVDYSAPPTPSVNPAPSISADSKSVSVNAQETGTTDVASYLVTITDPEGNKITPSFPAQNQNLPPTSIDVTTLDDGTLDIIIQAVDQVGNVSAAQSNPYTVTKNVGLMPNLGTSTLSANGNDTSFVDAETQSVQSPDKVTVGFTQTIKQSYQDQTKAPPATHDSSMCITTQNGNCLVSNAATVGSDKHSLTMKLTNKLPDGLYGIHATTYSAGNCPDVTPLNAPDKCDKFDGVVTDPNTGQPFRFRVDSTKPTISITSFTHPVTAKNEKKVNVAGTVTKTASTVQLLITSSGSGTAKLLNTATITQPTSSSDPNATWKAGPLDISSLPDGTLTIKATAKKSNGTSASAIAHGSMQAHLSHLTEATSHSRVTAGRQIRVTGVLTDERGHPISHADVNVRPRSSSGHFGKRVTVVTTGTGGYAAKFVPKHNATYYVTYAGSPQHDGARVHSARTLVRFAVTITSPAFGAHVSNPVTVEGKVAPGHKGAVVTIFRRTSGGRTVVGTARLNKHSRFVAHVTLPAGTDVIFASVKKASGNLGGKSKARTLHVG